MGDFVRDTCIGADSSCTPQTVRISVKPDGTQTNQDDPIGPLVAMAGNGLAGAFTSLASNLVANDNNNQDDVFLSLSGFSRPAATPAISALLPPSASRGSGDLVLTLKGALFLPGAQVLWNGLSLDTTYINNSTLEVFIPASNIVSAGSAQITVVNPPPGGTSAPATFTIN